MLNRWAAFVYGPLLEDRPRRIQESQSGAYGAKVAAEVHAELRRLGPVKPPREFVLMDRAAVGLGLGLPAPQGRGELAPPLPRPDRRVRREAAGQAPGEGARGGRARRKSDRLKPARLET